METRGRARCDALAPSALSTGVVDTILRSSVGTIGFNTNTWSAMSALEVLTGEAQPACAPHARRGGLGAFGRAGGWPPVA